MRNRAVITTEQKEIGVYVHWNGGRDSIEAFLTYCKNKGFRTPEEDCYGWARLCQVLCNYFDGTGLGVGIDLYKNLEHSADFDNGVYIIKDWEIIEREFFEGKEQNYYNLFEMLLEIDKAQPKGK
jgi:hypothetical protein